MYQNKKNQSKTCACEEIYDFREFLCPFLPHVLYPAKNSFFMGLMLDHHPAQSLLLEWEVPRRESNIPPHFADRRTNAQEEKQLVLSQPGH
jgi:hypothetical protein